VDKISLEESIERGAIEFGKNIDESEYVNSIGKLIHRDKSI